MVKPVDMARTAAEKKAEAQRYEPSDKPADQPDYPYGLKLRLDDATLKKLGIAEIPKPGVEMRIEGRACVVSARQSADEKGADRNVELQITHLLAEAPDEVAGKAVKAMYPSSKD